MRTCKWLFIVLVFILGSSVAYADFSDSFAWNEMRFAEQSGATAEGLNAIIEWSTQAAEIDFETAFFSAATQFPAEKRLDINNMLESDVVTGPFFTLYYKTSMTHDQLPDYNIIPSSGEMESFSEGSDPFSEDYHLQEKMAFYDYDRFLKFAETDAPIIFCVSEYMGIKLTGTVDRTDVYTRWFRVSFINANDNSLVAWFPVEYETLPAGLIRVSLNSKGQAVMEYSTSKLWGTIYKHLQMKRWYPMIVREGILIVCYADDETLRIPDGITELGKKAAKTIKFTNIVFPNSLEKIGEDALSFNRSIESVDIPGTVKTVGKYAFRGCNLLESVRMEEGVQSIGEEAFFNCGSLIRVDIPSSVQFIDETAFLLSEDVTIYSKPGSYAEDFAKAHGIPYEYNG